MAFAKLNSMKFVGLNGLKHFWTKAKSWIAGQITAEVTAKIAEIVANAPEDLDTLKEIADWISAHANDASAMNSAILANTEAISGKADKNHTHTKSQITDFDHTHDDRYYTESEIDTKLSGKSDTGHTHTKSQITDFPTSLKNPNALTINGKTYDGSSAVDAGVQTVANGGTGVTTQAEINRAFIGNLDTGMSDVTDGTEFVSSWASDNGFAETAEGSNTPYKRQFIKVWNYIKGKISSVLGLTKDNYGGKADTAGTADSSRNMYHQNLDLSALDKTKFYPLVCYSGIDFAEVAICSESGMGYMDYNQNRIHFDISTQGWSDLPPTLNIREYARYENNEITIGCIGRGLHNGAWAIWLRGGLHYTCYSRDSDLRLHTSDYTYGDEVYTVGTNYYGGSNTNVSIMFTPQSTITDGAYSSRQITAPNIKANRNITLDGSNGTSISTYGSEPLTIGFPSGTGDGQSLGIDRNSIQVRINGEASTMYLNYYGGMVIVNEQNQSNGGLKVKQKMVIPIGAPSSLEDGCIWIS